MKMLVNGITLIALIVYSLLSHAPENSNIKPLSMIQQLHKQMTHVMNKQQR